MGPPGGWRPSPRPSSATIAYDDRGNLIFDYVFTYAYDSANRMVSATPFDSAAHPNKVEFGYDDQGRRIWKKTYQLSPDSGDWTLSESRKFVYDGTNLVAEFVADAQGLDKLARTYAWGVGIGGGVGALLSITTYNTDGTPDKTYLPTFDGRGDVTGLVDAATGNVAATYAYAPFGELLSTTGSASAIAACPFRFSTMYFDAETDSEVFPNRVYNIPLARWDQRDPIQESGGVNVYAFNENDPINKIDPDGLSAMPNSSPPASPNPYMRFVPNSWPQPKPATGGPSPEASAGLIMWGAMYAGDWAASQPIVQRFATWCGINLQTPASSSGPIGGLIGGPYQAKEWLDEKLTSAVNSLPQIRSDTNIWAELDAWNKGFNERHALMEAREASRSAELSREIFLQGQHDALTLAHLRSGKLIRPDAIYEIEAEHAAIDKGALFIGGQLTWLNGDPDAHGSTVRWLQIEDVREKRRDELRRGGPRPIDLYTFGYSPEEADTMKEYSRKTNAWIAANGGMVFMKPTAGVLRAQADAAANNERSLAARRGNPYPPMVAGHVPDTTVTGLPDPPMGWLRMTVRANGYIGGVEGARIGRAPVNYFRVDGVKQ